MGNLGGFITGCPWGDGLGWLERLCSFILVGKADEGHGIIVN